MTLCHILPERRGWVNMVYSQNYFNLTEIILLMLFKMASKQTVLGRSVMKFIVPEKSKPYEIYTRICDVHGDFLVKKMFTNRQNISLPVQARVKNTVCWEEIYWLSDKEKVQGMVVSKEGHAGSLRIFIF